MKIGDLMVYPAHGVGRVTAFENQEIMGTNTDFCVIQILDNGMTIKVPTTRIDSVGIRSVIDKGEADAVMQILKRKKRKTVGRQTWNRRQRNYTDKIKTGSVNEIAEVLRDLYSLKNRKELSFGERKMLDTAQNLLVKELSIAMKTKEEKIQAMIVGIFQ